MRSPARSPAPWVSFAALILAQGALEIGHTADLKAPFELESAQVLPGGVRNPRFKNLWMWVDQKLNGEGVPEPLAAALNRPIAWKDVIAAQKTETDRSIVRGALSANGISEDGIAGSTTGQVNTFAHVMVPVFAIGVTERLTLALAAPVMNIDIQADTGFVEQAVASTHDPKLIPIQLSDAQRFINSVCESDPPKCNEAQAKLNQAINQKLTHLGYEPIHSRQFSGLGDVKMVGKYLLHRDTDNAWSAKAELTFPTGIPADPDKAVDVPTGDGQWDVGVGLAWDRRVLRQLTFTAHLGYTAQLPDQVIKRIPVSESESLSPDKELVSRDLGDWVQTGAALKLELASIGVNLGAGYSLQYLTHTAYQGQQHDSGRYRLLERTAPAQTLQSYTLMAGFSSVEWYREKKFFYPFQANLAFSSPITGSNVTRNDVFSAELVLFF